MLGEVANDFIGAHVGDGGAHRHGDHQVVAALAIALLAHAVLATLGAELALVAEVDQRAQVLVGHDPDTAAASPVTAVRPPQRNELLAAKANAAIATITGDDIDFCFVYEFHGMGVAK